MYKWLKDFEQVGVWGQVEDRWHMSRLRTAIKNICTSRHTIMLDGGLVRGS